MKKIGKHIAHLRMLREKYLELCNSDKDADKYIVDTEYGVYGRNDVGDIILTQDEYPYMFSEEDARLLEAQLFNAKVYKWKDWYKKQVDCIDFALLVLERNRDS